MCYLHSDSSRCSWFQKRSVRFGHPKSDLWENLNANCPRVRITKASRSRRTVCIAESGGVWRKRSCENFQSCSVDFLCRSMRLMNICWGVLCSSAVIKLVFPFFICLFVYVCVCAPLQINSCQWLVYSLVSSTELLSLLESSISSLFLTFPTFSKLN